VPGLDIPNITIVFLLAAIIASLVVSKTILGRYTFALGSNEEAARLSGVSVDRWKIAVYTLCGLFSGLAGVLIAARLNSAQPSLGQGYELDAIAAAVIGGTSLSGGEGSILGTAIGAFIISTLTNALRPLVVGKTLEAIAADMGRFWREITGDSQLRWIGPDKGAMHLATAAVVNAVWDLWAKSERKPVWKLLADMSPADVVRCIDFRYITDAITPDEALAILKRLEPTKREREEEMRREGFPAYTTSAGWLGYSDEKIRALCREAVNQGWTHVKIKVGRD